MMKYGILDVGVNNTGTYLGNLNAQGEIVTDFSDLISLTPFDQSGLNGKNEDLRIAVTKPNSNNETFVFVIQWVSPGGGIPGVDEYQVLLKFKIDQTGINYIGYNNLPTDLGILGTGRQEFEVVTVGSNYRLATAGTQGFNQVLKVFDLDGTTLNIVPGSIKTAIILNADTGAGSDVGYVRGIEFNQSGDLIWFTHQPNINRPRIIECFDYNLNTILTPTWSPLSGSQFEYSYIEMGLDGNLYLPNATHLAQISNINTPLTSNFNGSFQSINYSANYWDYSYSDDYDKRYTMPDQIDGMDYAAHFNNDPVCCLTGLSYDKHTYTATTSFPGGNNQTWTGSQNPLNGGTGNIVYMSGDLIIPSGINVTIQGMTIYFHPDARVIVQRSNVATVQDGAKLTMNGSTFTVIPDCGNDFMWKGVEVQGWVNQSQLPITNSRQGYLEMKNFSRIEHAVVGAQAYDSDLTDGLDPTNKGGIIRTSNSTFYNNKIDVRVWDYDNFNPTSGAYYDNQAYFKNTEFLTDGPLHGGVLPTFHAYIYEANGVRFEGCLFENVQPTYYTEATRGYGIYNIKSKLTVVPSCSSLTYPCTSQIPNTFRNLRYGIYCKSGNSLTTIKIDQNEFENNLYGVYIGTIDFPTVTRNNFKIATSVNPDFEFGKTYGIYLNSCSGFKVQENDFREMDDPSSVTGQTRGVIVYNSGDGEIVPPSTIPHNEIYKNTFTDLLIGGQSQGINAPDHFNSSDPFNPIPGGLQWLCNDFNSEIIADLYVSSGRIDYNQGYYVSPLDEPLLAPFAGARNIFSHTSGGYDIAAVTGVQTFEYTYYLNIETEPLSYTTPTISTDDIPLTIDYNQSCPTKIAPSGLSGWGYIGMVIGKMDALKNEITAKKQIIDGGNSNDLLELITTGSSGSVKNTLLQFSPYLSDEVLIAYIESNPPSGHLQQVLIANSPLSASVTNTLNQTNLPMGIKKQINLVQTGNSSMTSLNNSINYLITEREYWVDEAIRYYLNDSIAINPIDSVIQILKLEERILRKEQLCDALIIKGDLADAQIVRNEIISEKGGETNYTRIAEINIDKRFSSDALHEINTDSSLVIEIESIIFDTTDPRICPRGEALLYEYIYADAIYHLVEPFYVNGDPKSAEAVADEETVDQQIQIYPNPTSSQFNINFEGYDQPENFIIEFYNVVGQKIITQQLIEGQFCLKINVENVTPGIYFVHIKNNEGTVQVNKVVVE
ncbi:MAG: T9SS type A sorting domain-containing protein [Crocinitomicaceae bacterium]|nr:T9SS type A sorting domain-containing protein [Crocinitomicaceae bacterium]